MTLGGLTLKWNPDQETIPESKRDTASVQTYTSVAFFSFGSRIVGHKISLDWEWMPADQYLRLKQLEAADAQIIWDAETDDRLFYSSGVNTPFAVGGIITGGTSGATAVISAKDTPDENITLTGIVGTFQADETITDDSAPAKSATVTSLDIIPAYNVEIMALEGQYFEVIGDDIAYRRNVKLSLLIISEV